MTIISDRDGTVILQQHFIEPGKSDQLFTDLFNEIAWTEEVFNIYGKQIIAPRLVAWYGDTGSTYTYSGVTHHPLAWHPMLLELKKKIEIEFGDHYNSVLVNLYRNGQDSMGWHADKEKELGKNPTIASLSLGATRLFKLRHNKSKHIIDIELSNGCLVIMHGEFQHYWQHSIPKTKKVNTPRINLTFRRII